MRLEPIRFDWRFCHLPPPEKCFRLRSSSYGGQVAFFDLPARWRCELWFQLNQTRTDSPGNLGRVSSACLQRSLYSRGLYPEIDQSMRYFVQGFFAVAVALQTPAVAAAEAPPWPQAKS